MIREWKRNDFGIWVCGFLNVEWLGLNRSGEFRYGGGGANGRGTRGEGEEIHIDRGVWRARGLIRNLSTTFEWYHGLF